MKQSKIKPATKNQKLVSNEMICEQYVKLKSCIPITALVYQLAEALGPIYSHNKCFCIVVLECELVTKLQTLSPRAVHAIHSRMSGAESPSRCFWLVATLRTIPQSNLQKHSGEQVNHSGWMMRITKLTPSHMTSVRTDSCLKKMLKTPPQTPILESTASRNGSGQF